MDQYDHSSRYCLYDKHLVTSMIDANNSKPGGRINCNSYTVIVILHVGLGQFISAVYAACEKTCNDVAHVIE